MAYERKKGQYDLRAAVTAASVIAVAVILLTAAIFAFFHLRTYTGGEETFQPSPGSADRAESADGTNGADRYEYILGYCPDGTEAGQEATELFGDGLAAPSFYCVGGELFLGGQCRESVTVIIEDGGGEVFRRTISPGERVPLDGVPEGELFASFITEKDGGKTVFTASGTVLASAATGQYEGIDTVVMTGDVAVSGDFAVSVPFSWELGGHTFATDGELRFASDGEGTMAIGNAGGEVSCAAVSSRAVL